MKKNYLLLILLFIFFSCRNSNIEDNKKSNSEIDTNYLDSINKGIHKFRFLGEKDGRKENFDTNIVVSNGNIEELYSNYDITKAIESNDTVYYIIKSKKIYHDARFLTRIVQIIKNQQVNAITFYDYNLFYINYMENRLLVGLNSLAYSNPHYSSCFCAKILILNKNLEKRFEKRLQYLELEYTYIDTLYQTKEGFNAEIINVGFDSDYFYSYKACFNQSGKMLRSSKERKVVNSLH